MKPKNFPGRKEARQLSAIKRLRKWLDNPCSYNNEQKRRLTEIELRTLEGRIIGDARSIRTKKFGSRKLGIVK